jgi:hypothetical protein
MWGQGDLVIPAPAEIADTIEQVPEIRLITIHQIAAFSAQRHKVTCGCTVCTGIWASVVAPAAHEKELQGITGITPYWRVLKKDGELNLKPRITS